LIAGKVSKNDVRFFVGYSGWSPEQLEEEIKLKSWFVTSVSKEIVMNSDNDDLWKSILQTMGSKGKRVANLPEDPNLN
jgi:putative transcriptional regulator